LTHPRQTLVQGKSDGGTKRMAQLTALDATILKVQDPDQHASLAVGAVAVIDGPAPDFQSLKALLTERIQSVPRCTQLLRTHPKTPEWVDFGGFDLEPHLHRAALAPPRRRGPPLAPAW